MFIARGWVLNPLQGECWKILSLGIGLENPVSRDRIGQYYPAGRDGQQIHPRRVVLIDSVKINPSLVMMREWSMQVTLSVSSNPFPIGNQLCLLYFFKVDIRSFSL